MIGIDTNVLVRVFVEDNAHQTALARAFMTRRSAEDPAFVSAVVLVELVWALKENYGYERAAIHVALQSLIESANVQIEREDVLKAAVALADMKNADVADSIIAALAVDAGAVSTVTFDREAAKRIPAMELIK